jgi:CDGSH-type Zn-finger protein
MALNGPMKVSLTPGKAAWCACGKSKNQPFCDGSHAGSGITPVVFLTDEPRQAFLCLCKKTGNAPFCDGSHARD